MCIKLILNLLLLIETNPVQSYVQVKVYIQYMHKQYIHRGTLMSSILLLKAILHNIHYFKGGLTTFDNDN